MSDEDINSESEQTAPTAPRSSFAHAFSDKAAGLTAQGGTLHQLADKVHIDDLKEKVGPAADKLKEGADKVAGSMGDALHGLPEKTGELVDDAKHVAQSTWEKVVANFKH